ncbi:uncharacterized protein LOC118494923 [Sander lucioperca]|uniref:uncharacterized protein LOC118494923 n=1 Tax=Sander lucioperca TaxID=283035 RepID=UPI001653CAF2|nr:uncharacterized protein LOC118494923 [Sander lucioperca]
MALGHLATEDLITGLLRFGIKVTEEERSKFKDNEVDGEAVDYGLTERMVSYLFEGSFKKQAKFNRFVQQWKETVTLTVEPVPVHSEKATVESRMNICRRFEDGFKILVPTVLRLTQRKSPLADLALEEREAALTEDVPGIDFRAAILLLPILLREKNDILIILGEVCNLPAVMRNPVLQAPTEAEAKKAIKEFLRLAPNRHRRPR